MNSRNAKVTNTHFGVGGSSGCGIDGYQLNIYRHHNINGRFVSQRGDGDGLVFKSQSDMDKYTLEHGYSKRYSRNSCGFVSSRAYRKRTGNAYAPNVEFPMSVKAQWELGKNRAARRIAERVR